LTEQRQDVTHIKLTKTRP